jgi:hypothetical protein
MEGIEPAKFDEILGLADKGYGALCACAAGYRSSDDKYAGAEGALQAEGRDRARLRPPRIPMRAIRIEAIGRIAVADVPDPVPGPARRWSSSRPPPSTTATSGSSSGQYAGLKFPCIPGSDGAGVVARGGRGRRRVLGGPGGRDQPGFDWGPSEKAPRARLLHPRPAARRDARPAGRGARAQLSPSPRT